MCKYYWFSKLRVLSFMTPAKEAKRHRFWRNLYSQVTVNPQRNFRYCDKLQLKNGNGHIFEETEKGQESSFYVWLRDTIRAIIKRLFHVNVPMILVNKRLDYCREKFWGRITLNTALNIKPYFLIENVFLKKIKKKKKLFAPFTSVVWTIEKLQSYVELVEQNKTDHLFGFHIQIKGLGHNRAKQLH